MDMLRHMGWSGKSGTQLQTSLLWNNIYKKSSGDYEWGCTPDQFLAYDYRSNGFSMYASVNDTLPADCSVLMIGAGASLLGEALYDQGYQPVVQTDFSEVIVERRKETTSRDAYPNMNWECVDARFPLTSLLKYVHDASCPGVDKQHFGAVVDKGLIDGLYLAGGSSMDDIGKVVSNVAEVLAPERGVFVTLSYSAPSIISPLLKNKYFSSVEARMMESADIYLYRMSRGDMQWNNDT